MKKECTENEARLKAEAYCVAAERCTDDVLHKLEQWGLSTSLHELVIEHLKKERYVDDARYAVAYVRDKYRFNQWGRIKISQTLKMKHIDSWSIALALQEIDEEEYLAILMSLLRKKAKGVKASNKYERNGKLVRFAASHGYEMDTILRCMEQMEDEDGLVE